MVEMGCTWSDMHEMSNNFLMMKNPNKIQIENLRVKNPNSGASVSGPYQRRDLSNCGAGRLRIANN